MKSRRTPLRVVTSFRPKRCLVRKLTLLSLLLPIVFLTYACDERWPAEPEAAVQEDHPTFASRPNWQFFGVDIDCPSEVIDVWGYVREECRYFDRDNNEALICTTVLTGEGEGDDSEAKYRVNGTETHLNSITRGSYHEVRQMRVKVIGLGQAPDFRVTVQVVRLWSNDAMRVDFSFEDWQCELP